MALFLTFRVMMDRRCPWKTGGATDQQVEEEEEEEKRKDSLYLSLACHSSARGALSLEPFFYVPPHSPRDLPFEPADGKLQGNYFSFVFIIVLFLLSSSFFPAWLFPAEISNSALK